VRGLSARSLDHLSYTRSGKLSSFSFLRNESADVERRLVEVKGMADRIIFMRDRLYQKLVDLKTPGEWGHIKSQIGEFRVMRGTSRLTLGPGMFSFTGLKAEQVDALAQKAHIYLTRDGRISMAGLNESNVDVSLAVLHAAIRTLTDHLVLCGKCEQGCERRALSRRS